MTRAASEAAVWLAGVPALERIEGAARAVLEGAARTVRIPAGTVLFDEGSGCSAYLIVHSGSVRVHKTTENGREIILYRVGSGNTCVLTTACLLGGQSYDAVGVAETDVAAVAVPAAVFRRLLGESEAFRDFVFASFSTRLSQLMMLVEEVVFRRIDVRLARFLAAAAPEGGLVRATHQEIAAELGSAREVVSRQLKEFERDGLVALSRGRLDVRDAPGLSRLAASTG